MHKTIFELDSQVDALEVLTTARKRQARESVENLNSGKRQSEAQERRFLRRKSSKIILVLLGADVAVQATATATKALGNVDAVQNSICK